MQIEQTHARTRYVWSLAMKARRLISEGGFGPEDIAFLTEVLENVWDEVKPDRLVNGLEKSALRERLAVIIIAMAGSSQSQSPKEFHDQVHHVYLEQSQWQMSAEACCDTRNPHPPSQ
jgi:hypothetical protein